MKCSGIDLHSNNSVVTVTDEEDHVVAEKRLPNALTKIVGLLMPWREELAGVVVESTFNWYWLVDGLKAAGFAMHLANTTAINATKPEKPGRFVLHQPLGARPGDRGRYTGTRNYGLGRCGFDGVGHLPPSN